MSSRQIPEGSLALSGWPLSSKHVVQQSLETFPRMKSISIFKLWKVRFKHYGTGPKASIIMDLRRERLNRPPYSVRHN